MIERWRMAVAGVVQGIGFRPFVYRLATDLALSGFVRNDGAGVVMELEGAHSVLLTFEDRLGSELPVGGRIDRVERVSLPAAAAEGCFEIKKSVDNTPPLVSLAPDRAVCDACLREMADPEDRRHRYPFINCTHCGPRYTITRKLPYDRPMTTMATFEMCPECRAEYENPLDRRYHAQPVACPHCGPRAWLHLPDTGSDSNPPPSLDPAASAFAVRRAAEHLSEGRLVAVKGLGGFHLSADASSKLAVMRLRSLKRRQTKPFALMARDLRTARELVQLDRAAEALLTSPAAPIVLAPKQRKCEMAAWVAPGLDDLGVMLPYTPLHHMLLRDGPPVVVMTSGNPPAEPITIDNREAHRTLGADVYLMHNREIAVANDDSVIRTGYHGPVFIRRSRGYVPDPIDVSHLPDRTVLALGTLLKVTLASIHQGQLVVGRHLGDLDNERAENVFYEEVERTLTFGAFAPEAVAVDLHPDIPSGPFAEARFLGIPIVRVQHHHAHLAAVLLEHGLGPDDEAVGILLDGFGYGADGTIWGGEVFVGGFRRYERVAHLRPIPQPGGDRGAMEPARMATSLLVEAGCDVSDVPGYHRDIAEILGLRTVSPLTSSVGRLFDGASSLLGVGPKLQRYEGEAAALVEATADPLVKDAYPLPISGGLLDTRVLTRALVADDAPVSVRAARFINAVADGFAKAAAVSEQERVVLGGGAIVNRLLTRRLVDQLQKRGKTVLLPKRLPAGDGGISAGQAAVGLFALDEGR